MFKHSFPASVAAIAVVSAFLASPANAADFPTVEPYVPEPAIPYEEPAPVNDGFYFGLRGGISFLENTSFEFIWPGQPDPLAINQYDPGFYAAGLVGYKMDLGIGGSQAYVELEGGYFEHEANQHRVGGAAYRQPFSGGDTEGVVGLLNLGLIADTGMFIRPFVSAGAGIAYVSFERHHIHNGVGGWPVVMDDSDTVFAYQLSGGFLAAITDKVDLEASYRYFAIPEIQLSDVNGWNSKTDLGAHQIMVGLRHSW